MTEQVSHAVEAIKLAYLSHTPVVWLVTGDKEVASEIVKEFNSVSRSSSGSEVMLSHSEMRSEVSCTSLSSSYIFTSRGHFEISNAVSDVRLANPSILLSDGFSVKFNLLMPVNDPISMVNKRLL